MSVDPTYKEKNHTSMEYIKEHKPPNILFGVIAGIIASIVGSIIYALYPFLFGIQINFLAVGVGLIVGFAIHLSARGGSPILGIVGAILSLVSCILGDVLSVIAIYSFQNEVPFFGILSHLNLSSIFNILSQITRIENVLFYITAMLMGYWISSIPLLPTIPRRKEDELKAKRIWRTRWILISMIAFVVTICLVTNFIQQL